MINFKEQYSKLLVILAILLGLIAVNFLIDKSDVLIDQNQESTTSSQTEILEQQTTQPVSYQATADGQNAFELLQANADIAFKEYDFGVFVDSINGVAADNTHFWALYVNNEQATAGATQTILQNGDLVEWRYEELQ